MVEPLPRWARAFVVAVVVAGLAFAVARRGDDGVGPAQPAYWHVAPGAVLGPASRHVPVTVLERGCASGRGAQGRIEASVRYERDRVTVDIGVRPYGGGQDCQGHPSTPYVVHLDEPLGHRPVAGERPVVPSPPS